MFDTLRACSILITCRRDGRSCVGDTEKLILKRNAYAVNRAKRADGRTIAETYIEREVDVTFMPCGHLICYVDCDYGINRSRYAGFSVRVDVHTYLASERFLVYGTCPV